MQVDVHEYLRSKLSILHTVTLVELKSEHSEEISTAIFYNIQFLHGVVAALVQIDLRLLDSLVPSEQS